MVRPALVASRLMVATTLTVASASWFTKMFRATPLAPTTMHPRVVLKSHLGIRPLAQSRRHLPMLFSQKLPSTQIAMCQHPSTEELHGASTPSHSKVKTRSKSTHQTAVTPAMLATPPIAVMPDDASDASDASDSSDASDTSDDGGSSDDGGCASTTQAPLWLLTALIACRRRKRPSQSNIIG